jgi:hypothetical protein
VTSPRWSQWTVASAVMRMFGSRASAAVLTRGERPRGRRRARSSRTGDNGSWPGVLDCSSLPRPVVVIQRTDPQRRSRVVHYSLLRANPASMLSAWATKHEQVRHPCGPGSAGSCARRKWVAWPHNEQNPAGDPSQTSQRELPVVLGGSRYRFHRLFPPRAPRGRRIVLTGWRQSVPSGCVP